MNEVSKDHNNVYFHLKHTLHLKEKKKCSLHIQVWFPTNFLNHKALSIIYVPTFNRDIDKIKFVFPSIIL